MLLICFEEVHLETDFLCPCGGDGVKETEFLSSWTDVAAGLP